VAFGSIGGRGRFGSGILRGLPEGIADPFKRLLKGSCEKGSVDGEKNGPVSKEQPFAVQPVAAGPTKVGENSPKVEDVTVGFVAGAAAASATEKPLMTNISKTTVENRIDLCFPLLLLNIGSLLKES
jgi:hypothetical protein